MALNPNERVLVSPLTIDPRQITLASLTLTMGFMRPKNVVEEVFSVDELVHFFHQNFDGMLCTVEQPYYFEYHGHAMKANIKGSSYLSLSLASLTFRRHPAYWIGEIWTLT